MKTFAEKANTMPKYWNQSPADAMKKATPTTAHRRHTKDAQRGLWFAHVHRMMAVVNGSTNWGTEAKSMLYAGSQRPAYVRVATLQL